MRFRNGIAVFVPWMDADGNRNHTRFTFKGDVDRRRVRRSIRASLTKIGMHPPKAYLDFHIKHRSYELGS